MKRPRSISNAILFLQVLLFASAVPLLLCLKLHRLAAILDFRTPSASPNAADVERIAACVERAIHKGRPLVRSGCLTRGLTRYYFLRRAGLHVSLCFGMSEAVGHCWLERNGEPFLEPSDPRKRFLVMYRIPNRIPVPAGASAAMVKP